MKRTLENLEDIQLLVRTFYKEALDDEMLNPFFNHLNKNSWDRHLEGMDSFWSNVLLYTDDYSGNPMQVHQMMHQFKKLDPEVFNRYLLLFNKIVSDLFYGETAEVASQRVASISQVMQSALLSESRRL